MAFYYDTDNTGTDGVAAANCAAAAEGTGVDCAWDTTGVTPGDYYIYGITDDGIAAQVSSYSSGTVTVSAVNTAPTLTINQPDGTGDSVTVGSTFNINYDLADTEQTVTVAFYYDTDNTGTDGVAAANCAAAAEGTGVDCAWDTTGVTPGDYYIYGITDDGIAAQVSSYSSGTVTVNAINATYYYKGNSNFTSPETVAGTTTDIARACSTAGNTQINSIGSVPQIASAGSAWDSCVDNRYRYNSTGVVQVIMADTAYAQNTAVTGQSNTIITTRSANNNGTCTTRVNVGYMLNNSFTSFGSSSNSVTRTDGTWFAGSYDLSTVSGTVPAGATVAIQVEITASTGDCRFAYGSGGSAQGSGALSVYEVPMP